MTEPTRAVARPPIGSENHLPTWTRESLETEVLRAVAERRRQHENSWWNKPENTSLVMALIIGGVLALITNAHAPADPLTIAGDQDD